MSAPTPLYKHVKAVCVRWIDSQHSAGWWHDHKDNDLYCVSVGLLVDKNRHRIKLALSASDQTWGHYIEIPMCTVKSIKPVKIPT